MVNAEVVTGVIVEQATIRGSGWIIIAFIFILACFFFWRWQVELYARKNLQNRLNKELEDKLTNTSQIALKRKKRAFRK